MVDPQAVIDDEIKSEEDNEELDEEQEGYEMNDNMQKFGAKNQKFDNQSAVVNGGEEDEYYDEEVDEEYGPETNRYQ